MGWGKRASAGNKAGVVASVGWGQGGAIDSKELIKVGGGQGMCTERGVSLGNRLGDTADAPPDLETSPRKRTTPQPHPAWSQGWSWGWGLTALLFLLPRFLLPCQRKLTEEGGGQQWSWAGHPVTQAKGIFIDIHGADSKASWWQMGPGMRHWGLQPALPFAKLPRVATWVSGGGKQALERHNSLCQGPGDVGRPAWGKYKNR